MSEQSHQPPLGDESSSGPQRNEETVIPGNETPETGLYLVSQIFKHALHQADVERILATLSASDRDEFVSKIGDLRR